MLISLAGRILAPMLVATMSLVLSSCGVSTDTTDDKTGDDTITEVRANIPGFISDAAMVIAMEKGYFGEENIRIKASRQSGPASIPQLASGQLDVSGGAAGAGLFNSIRQGIKLKIIADKGSNKPGSPSYEGLVVRKELHDSGTIRDAGDLRGRTVALTSTDSVVEYNVARLLSRHGLSIKDVDLKVMDAPTQLQALANGSIDAAEINEPALTTALQRGIAKLIAPADTIDPSEQIAVLMASEKFVEDRDLVVRFMKAYLRGARDYNEAFFNKSEPAFKQEIVDILAAKTTVRDKSLYQNMRFAYLHPDGAVNVDSLQRQMQYYVDKGSLKKPVTLQSLVDVSYARAAAQELTKN